MVSLLVDLQLTFDGLTKTEASVHLAPVRILRTKHQTIHHNPSSGSSKLQPSTSYLLSAIGLVPFCVLVATIALFAVNHVVVVWTTKRCMTSANAISTLKGSRAPT
jgi:hypothetical protein